MHPIAVLPLLAALVACASGAPPAPASQDTPAPQGSSLPTPAGSPPASAPSDNPPPAAAAPLAPETLTVTLQLGAETRLPDGSRLRYLRLANDSRCAEGVQCVWAGDAKIQVRWQAAKGSRSADATLHTSTLQGRAIRAEMGPWTVELKTLARGIAPAATLAVSRTGD